tara:strand:+ start:2718 stop:3434 length:717 start_codon:yes stop_codon:yes gene_type:complete
VNVSVILPVVNETYSLRKTINIINQSSKRYIKEYLIIICKKTKNESIREIQDLKQIYGDLIVTHIQKKPFLGGALREGFDLASGSHIILMASDLETDPNLVNVLISYEKENLDGIITASRWLKGGSFSGYSKTKFVFNYVFQKILSLIYGSNLTDMTYAFRIMPTTLVKNIIWEEIRHPFLLETIIKPLRLGIKIKEIPANWKSRTEGESQNTFLRNFEYLRIALRTRFYSRDKIIKN